MNIHEYQAKILLAQYGIPVAPFRVASNITEVSHAIDELGLKEGVLKVQVHAGGRGKAGGVKFAEDPEEIVRLAEQMIGMKIVNNQTGPEGVVAEKILISPPVAIQKEYYLAATIDRVHSRAVLIASPDGGMEIEEIAAKNPERILTIPIELDGKIRPFRLIELAKFMGWEGDLKKEGMELCTHLAKAFIETDSSLLEINPLVLTEDHHLIALDAKFSVDDNALYRQAGIAQWYDPLQYPKNEVLAQEYHLAYISLHGNIGCLVNGAGLAMATMDIIRHYGGEPANFLDVGGGATKDQIANGFKIILLDPAVKCIFINIFGGIMDCGVLAQGIVAASKEIELTVPLVVRMEGTHVENGKKILQESGINYLPADNMADGAIKAVQAAGGKV